jgi:hypothetical protein
MCQTDCENGVFKNGRQRACIWEGWEIVFRLSITAAWLFDKVNQ